MLKRKLYKFFNKEDHEIFITDVDVPRGTYVRIKKRMPKGAYILQDRKDMPISNCLGEEGYVIAKSPIIWKGMYAVEFTMRLTKHEKDNQFFIHIFDVHMTSDLIDGRYKPVRHRRTPIKNKEVPDMI